MKIETRPVSTDYFICDHCGNEYARKSEAEFCEVECVRLRIRLTCKHEFFYTLDLGEEEIEVSKKCSCGFVERYSIEVEKLTEEEENQLAEPLFYVFESSLKSKEVHPKALHTKGATFDSESYTKWFV